jgi:hypothetical protein
VLDDVRGLGIGPRKGAQDRLWAARPHGAQNLLRAAELRHEPVCRREHRGSRPVVLLQPDDRRVRKPLRHAEQVLGARAREGVDRLVVVTDRAELVAVAEPPVE